MVLYSKIVLKVQVGVELKLMLNIFYQRVIAITLALSLCVCFFAKHYDQNDFFELNLVAVTDVVDVDQPFADNFDVNDEFLLPPAYSIFPALFFVIPFIFSPLYLSPSQRRLIRPPSI